MIPLLKILQCLPISLRIEATRENCKVSRWPTSLPLLVLTSLPIALSSTDYASATLVPKPDTLPPKGSQFTCSHCLESFLPRYQRSWRPHVLHITQVSSSQWGCSAYRTTICCCLPIFLISLTLLHLFSCIFRPNEPNKHLFIFWDNLTDSIVKE